jgi:hypothetical protein
VIVRNVFAIEHRPMLATNQLSETKRRFNDVYQQYVRTVCAPGIEKEFWNRASLYRGNGIFVPTLIDDTLDKITIEKNLPLMQQKANWIENNIKRLEKEISFNHLITWNSSLRSQLDHVVSFKQKFLESSTIEEKEKIRKEARLYYKRYQDEVLGLMNSLYFMQSFNFPVDHFQLRSQYDLFKKRKDQLGKRKANEMYFLRRVVEDGTQNPDGGKNDAYMRSVMNTIAIALSKPDDFIREELRYDLEFIFNAIDDHLKRGPIVHLSRLREWLRLEKNEKVFYHQLLKNQFHDDATKTTSEYVLLRSTALKNFKSFVQAQQRKVYDFWMKQPEIYQALFVLDAILMMEVGGIDGRDMLERRDVAQVAINRRHIDYFSSIASDDDLYPYLSDIADLQNQRWLNVLFKEGEFSFTYFFIPSTIRIFCPEMSRYGQFIRDENVNLSLDLLSGPDTNFPALRYYSRASMFGRIEMDPLWHDFLAYPERPGLKLEKGKEEYSEAYKTGNFKFLYHFTDAVGDTFKVLEIKDKKVVSSFNGEHFYQWRNPNLFRYFIKK